MTLRRLTAVPLLAILLVAGCTDADSGDGDDEGTDEVSAEETDVEIGGEEPEPITVDDEEFEATIAPLREQLQATGDVCDVIGMVNSVGNLPEPTGPAQMEGAVNLSADVFVAIGTSVSGQDPEAAAKIGELADTMRSEAAAAGYPDDFLATSTAFDDPGFAAAMESATAVAATECPDLISGAPPAE